MEDQIRTEWKDKLHRVGQMYQLPGLQPGCGCGTDCEAVCEESRVYETASGDAYELAEFRFLATGYVSQPYVFTLRADYRYRFEQADIPLEYRGKTLQDFHWDLYHEDTSLQKKLVNAFVNKWERVRDRNQGLYIYSNTWGSGKTLLACCIANELIQKYNVKAKFVNITEYLDLCKDRGDVYNELFNCGLLIVDDMGAQDTTHHYVAEMVYKLVNRRYANHKITIYTSNLPYDSDRYEGKIRSRLLKNYELIIPEESIRKRFADQENSNFMKELLE